MADLFVGEEGNLNGTTPVTIISAPGASEQHVTAAGSVSVYNNDTVDHRVIFQKNKAGTITEIARVLITSLGAGLMPKKVVLDDTDETLEAVSDATATTTEPKFDSAYLKTS